MIKSADMTRPRLIRGLRIAWSVWWGILFVLLIVLWVRSYWRMDIVAILSPRERLMAVSNYGQIYCAKGNSGLTTKQFSTGGRQL